MTHFISRRHSRRHSNHHSNRTFAAASVLILLAGGCASARHGSTSEAGTVRPDGGSESARALTITRDVPPIELDGDIAEWPSDVALAIDEHHLFVRFTIDNAQFTLQGSPEPVAVMLDLDASTATGFVSSDPRLHQMGVDLQITFSPPPPGKNRGVEIVALDAKGTKTPVAWEDIDFSFSPTYASSWYEMRMTRTPEAGKADSGVTKLPKAGLFTQGRVEGVVALLNDNGSLAGTSDLMAFDTPSMCTGHKLLSTMDLPTKAPGTLRVVSWNVERSSPIKDPVRFRDVLTAIQPDVVLVQEWEEGDGQAMKSWFDINTPASAGAVSRDPASGWHVAKPAGTIATGGGVAVVSRWPLELVASPVTLPDGKPIRFAPAIIKSPYGDLFAGSLHLKCCGTKGSKEDQQRMAEAKAINTFVATHATSASIRFFGGDFNLVGSRPPLDLARAGIDADGTDLSPAQAETLGDRTFATWRDAGEFTPGRLDWIVYSDASAKITGAWVLDTSRLGQEPLALMNLKPDSTNGSDHLPVIVDLKPIK
jgi:endonuclease/exonuclease/phosphatase family metal-dependent hydrolase